MTEQSDEKKDILQDRQMEGRKLKEKEAIYINDYMNKGMNNIE